MKSAEHELENFWSIDRFQREIEIEVGLESEIEREGKPPQGGRDHDRDV